MVKYCFVGLDIGRYENCAFVLDNNREKMKEFEFLQTHVGYEQLINEIHSLEKEGFTPIVGAEGHCGNMAPLDEYLLKEGIIFKPLHPTAVNRHKDVLGQPQKTDFYDAYAIADLLFFQHQTTETIKTEQQVSELKSLSRAYKSLTKAKTRFSNQLQQELMSYFPELLNEKVFSTVTCKTALHLLAEYPTPKELLSLSLSELTSFLSSQSKGHLGEATAREIHKKASSIQRQPSYVESKGLIVSTLAKQILSIDENLKQIKQQIDKISEKSETLQRIKSMDGAGSVLCARLMGEVISFERFESEPKLAMFLGVAPISDDSGKRKGRHKTTHRVNKIAKDAIMQIAECNRRVCQKSKAYYQKKRAEGKSHWQAIKCLARQLVRVLWAMFRDNTFYGQPSTCNTYQGIPIKEVITNVRIQEILRYACLAVGNGCCCLYL